MARVPAGRKKVVRVEFAYDPKMRFQWTLLDPASREKIPGGRGYGTLHELLSSEPFFNTIAKIYFPKMSWPKLLQEFEHVVVRKGTDPKLARQGRQLLRMLRKMGAKGRSGRPANRQARPRINVSRRKPL